MAYFDKINTRMTIKNKQFRLMKKTIGNKIFIFLIVFALFSCENKVKIDIEAKSKTLSVDAFINDLQQNQKVRLTYTDSYFSGVKPPALTGATVVFKDITAGKTYNFTDNNNGDYIYNLSNMDTIVYANHFYELNIKHNNYEYIATTTCKIAAEIDSLFFEFKEANTTLGNNAKAGNQLRLFARDVLGNISDYYWIKIFKNGKFFSRLDNMQLLSFDRDFDGEFFEPEVWNTFGPEGDVDPCLTGDVARLEIHGISRDALDFLSLGQTMSNNGGLFAVTPVNIPTNIISLNKSNPKVVGMFCVSSVSYGELTSP
jgi:hypothetical protein